jgi:single-stranded-DNA-specific exonuclease
VARFLDPRLQDLTDPSSMVDRQPAAERIARAVRAAEPICVFGDYDCDGITSAAIMTSVLRSLGAQVTPLLASRFDGGYGVSAAAAGRIASSGATLLITCDCGSSDHVSLADLSKRGIDIVVIDHHLVPDEPLPALAFLNPNRPDCGFDFKGLASCGLALSVAAALRKELGADLDLRKWLDLVAIGTIADVVPLERDNRALTRAGLLRIARGERPGVRALLELAQFDAAKRISGEDVAFRIAPRINAPGRLGPPDLALDLLLADTPETARGIAAQIEQLQKERRAIQDRMIAEAVEEIEREGWADRSAIVIGRADWNHGIVGIVAGRLVGRYGKPCVVVGFQEGRGRGSVRGPAGARLHDALTESQSVLERFGGHQAAAGLEVREERLGELREAFEAACTRIAGRPGAEQSEPETSVLLEPGDDPRRVLADLERLEPCGQSNPQPQLLADVRVVAAREVRGGHLKLELELAGGTRLSGFGPSLGARVGEIGDRARVLGSLRADSYRGGGAVEMRVSEVRPLE